MFWGAVASVRASIYVLDSQCSLFDRTAEAGWIGRNHHILLFCTWINRELREGRAEELYQAGLVDHEVSLVHDEHAGPPLPLLHEARRPSG